MLATIFALVAATAAVTDIEEISHNEAEARARACEFAAIQVSYEELLQSDLVIISDAQIDETQLECLAKAMDGTAYIVMVPTEYMTRFSAFTEALARPRLVPLMEAALQESGFGLPPPYDPLVTTEEEYALILEAHCGPDATGALSSSYDPHSFSPSWVAAGGQPSPSKFAAVQCLQASAFVANFQLFFLGNEITVRD